MKEYEQRPEVGRVPESVVRRTGHAPQLTLVVDWRRSHLSEGGHAPRGSGPTARISETVEVDIGRVGFAVLPVAAAAGFGGLASRNAPAVYQRLRKPRWAPPASAFGPVWSTLYLAIAVAGWRIYATASPMTRRLHLTQLALNGAWPAAFFGIRDKHASVAIIAALDLSLGLEIVRLRREDRDAAGLLMPYLAWCGFATALNAAVSEPEASHSE